MKNRFVIYSLFGVSLLSLISFQSIAQNDETNWEHILSQMEQINQELDQDSSIIETQRQLDGELFLGCHETGARDSLNFFLKKLEELKKISSPSSLKRYEKCKMGYYKYAKKVVQYAHYIKTDNSELIRLYNKIEKLFLDYPNDTIPSLCFNLEKTRLQPVHLDLGDYGSYELSKYIEQSNDAKTAYLRLFWPSAYFFGRFNSAPYLLQQIAEISLVDADYVNALYYADRASHWYRTFHRDRDYDGMSNRERCKKIIDEAYNLEKQSSGTNVRYAFLSTQSDLSESAKIARELSLPFVIANEASDVVRAYFYREIGIDKILEGNIDLGTFYLLQSIEDFNKIKDYLNNTDKSFVAHNYLVLSMAYEQMGDYDNAINALNNGSLLYPDVDPNEPVYEMSQFCMLVNLANIYFDNGKNLSAHKVVQSIDKIWNDDGQLHFDFTPLIGLSYSTKEQILGAYDMLYNYSCIRRQISRENFDEAEILLKNGLERVSEYNLGESKLKSLYLSCLIELLISQNKHEEARPYVSDLIGTHYGNIPINTLIHGNILYAKLESYNDNTEAALAKCNDALTLLENYITSTILLLSESERENFYARLEPDFNELISICTSSKLKNESDASKILSRISLISKGLLLSSSNYLKYLVLTSGDKDIKKKYNRIVELRNRNTLSSSENDVHKSSNSELARLEFELLNHSLIRSNVTNWISFISPNMEQIQSALKDKEAAIDFIKLDTDIESHSLIERDQFYYAIIFNRSSDPFVIPIVRGNNLGIDLNNLTSQICDEVWTPLYEYIKTAETIYFSPVGILNNLPLENMSEVFDLSNTKVVRLSSLRELAFNNIVSSKSKAILFGGINYNSGASVFTGSIGNSHNVKRNFSFDEGVVRAGISPLQHTLFEVTGIKKLFDDDKRHSTSASVKSSYNATEQYFRTLENSDVNILHFATHGFYADEHNSSILPNLNMTSTTTLTKEDLAMTRTGLFLAGANGNFKGQQLHPENDGILTAREVSNLYFPNLELVVLSACKTGLGDINGEGVYGLQRGFKKAGAKTILMSLWEVNDLATSMLVQEFYKYWIETGSQSKALVKAQDKVKNYNNGSNNFSDPFYWAGFVLLDPIN